MILHRAAHTAPTLATLCVVGLGAGCSQGPDPSLGEWVCVDRRLAPTPPEASDPTGETADTAAETPTDTGPGSILGATRQACPVDGVSWQLDLRGANSEPVVGDTDVDGANPGAVFTAVDVDSGTFESVDLRATPGDPGTWTLTPLSVVAIDAESPPFADLQLACTLRTPDDLGVRVLHCAGSHTAFDADGTASRETWDLRMLPAPTP
jgi:hypothetical protein